MFRAPRNGFEQSKPPSQAIPAEGGEGNPWRGMEQAIPIREQLDSLRNWRERLSPKFRRVYSAGKLLFQFVGVAGYAGYFASMHTFMRIVSGALMAGAWYAIYKLKGATRPFLSEARVSPVMKPVIRENRPPTTYVA